MLPEAVDGLLVESFGSIGGNCSSIATGHVDDFLKRFRDDFGRFLIRGNGGFVIRGNVVFGLVGGLDSLGFFDDNFSLPGKLTLLSFAGIGGSVVGSFGSPDGDALASVSFCNFDGNMLALDIRTCGNVLVVSFIGCSVLTCSDNGWVCVMLGSGCVSGIGLESFDGFDVILLTSSVSSSELGDLIGNILLGAFGGIDVNVSGIFGD